MADYRVIDVEQLESDLTVVADSIREKGGTSEQLAFPNGMADAVRGIQSGGSDDNSQYATEIKFANMNLFGKPKVSISLNGISSLRHVFNASVLNETVQELEVFCENKVTDLANFVTSNIADTKNALKKLIINFDTSQCTNFSAFVWKQVNIEEIVGELDCTSATNFSLWLNTCRYLREIRIKEKTIFVSISFPDCNSLSDESIQSIIDGLADLTEQTSQTLTFNSNVKLRITEAQISQITSKNWTLA